MNNEVKIRVLPAGPAEGEHYRKPVIGAKTNSIEKGQWYRKHDYQRLGTIIGTRIDTILSAKDYRDGILEVIKIIEDLPKHIKKPVLNKLDQIKSKEQLTTLVYRMILCYTL